MCIRDSLKTIIELDLDDDYDDYDDDESDVMVIVLMTMVLFLMTITTAVMITAMMMTTVMVSGILGGQLGLFLGASLLTIIELSEHLLCLLWSTIRHLVNKPLRANTSTE